MTLAERLDRAVHANFPWLFAVVIAIAIALHLPSLNTPLLDDREARHGFAAVELAARRPAPSGLADSAAYAALSAMVFSIAGASTASARFLPAIAGVLLAGSVLILRQRLGSTLTLGAAVLLALSPASAALSRTADGAILGGLGFGLLVALLYGPQSGKRSWLTGGVMGWMVAAGPVGLGGILVVLAASAAEHLLAGRWRGAAGRSHAWQQLGQAARAPGFWVGSVVAGVTASTTLIFPGGVGTLGQGLAVWGRSFAFAGPTGLGQALLLVIGYETLALAFAVAAARVFLKSPDLGLFIPLLAVTALVYFFARPGRLAGDALLVVIPLAIMAAVGLREVLTLLSPETLNGVIVLEMALILGLGVFAYQSLTAYAVQPDVPTYGTLRLALGGVAILGIFLVAGLFATGWSGNVAGAVGGLGVGLAAMLLVGELSAVWGVSFSRRANGNELWWESSSPRELNLLVASVEEISVHVTGTPNEVAVILQGERHTALGWAFKDFIHLQFVDQPSRLSDPMVYIAPLLGDAGSEAMPELAANYAGQGLTVRERRAWHGLPPEPIGWWLYRMGPVTRDRVILWAREDVQFPPAQP